MQQAIPFEFSANEMVMLVTAGTGDFYSIK